MSLRKLFVYLLVVIATTYGIVSVDEAQAQTKPIQLALWKPVQLFSSDTSVTGLRLNLIYGVNQDVLGIDLGLVNQTLGDQTGFQYGAVNITEGSFVGLRGGIVNVDKEGFTGIQYGLINMVDGSGLGWTNGGLNVVRNDFKGLLTGAINFVESDEHRGIQLAAVNFFRMPAGHQGSGDLSEIEGVQVGFVNYAKTLAGLQVGIVNYADYLRGVQIGLCNIITKGKIPFLPIVNFNFAI
ncbi:LA_2272 family surface repeat-containing protein [Candidatus Poribacteria bacterium]